MCPERYHSSVEVIGDMRKLEEYFNILYYTDTFVLQKCIFPTGCPHIYSELSSSSYPMLLQESRVNADSH